MQESYATIFSIWRVDLNSNKLDKYVEILGDFDLYWGSD